MPQFAFSRFLNVRNAYSPSISPDGARVAFLSDITGVPQVWGVPIEGGWPDQLTFHTERVATVDYAPDGGHILYGMDTGGNERQGLHTVTPDGADAQPLETDPDAIHSWGAWSPDGTRFAYAANARDQRFSDLYIRPFDGPATMVYRHDSTNMALAWHPNGESLLFTRLNTYLDTDLFLLDLASGEARLLTAHEGEAIHASPHFVGETTLLLISDRDREFRAPASLDLTTGEMRYLAETTWEAEELTATDDGRVVAYTVNEDGYSRLHLTVDDTPVAVNGVPDGVIAGLDRSRDGSTLVFAHYGATRNGNIWGVETATGRARQVTNASRAGIPIDALVEPELVHYTSFDGLVCPAFLYRPRGMSGPLPTVISVHGGPEGQARPMFNPNVQYFVHRGFAVLATNVRGSTGYGKAYGHMDDVRKRMDSVADLDAAAAWLIASGTTPAERIAVMGGSYGGFMTLAALTTYPERWRCGVELFGIANFVTLLEKTGPWRRKLREAEYGNLEDDRDFLVSVSPIHKADRIVAPLLVFHGTNDPRVPIGESEQIVDTLRTLGREVEYFRYEHEGHGFVRLPNRIHCAEATAAFLERHLSTEG